MTLTVGSIWKEKGTNDLVVITDLRNRHVTWKYVKFLDVASSWSNSIVIFNTFYEPFINLDEELDNL